MSGARPGWLAYLLVAVLAATALGRPVLPVDETRYAGVAWEMLQRGDFLVPWQNAAPYSHKPPLLFWLMQAGWAVFGVNEWWPRAVPALFAAGSLWLVAALARELWPERRQVAQLAPLVLAGCVLWTYFVGAIMFDMMIAFFVLLGWLGLVRAWRGAPAGGFALFALGLGGALMSKGPVALLHLLPPALLAPWWLRAQPVRWRRWYLGVALGGVAGAALVLAWAIPAGFAGGDDYRRAIFWGQTSGRITESFAHRRPVWYYLPLLPLILAPWALWPRFYLAARGLAWREPQMRFLLVAALVPLAGLSLISGKQAQYLLPEFALFAVLVARALDEAPAARPQRWSLAVPAVLLALCGVAVAVAAVRLSGAAPDPEARLAATGAGLLVIACAAVLAWRRPADPAAQVRDLACAFVAAIAAVQLSAGVLLRDAYDLRPIAQRIRALQDRGVPVANEGKYHGQFHFPGRLLEPIDVIQSEQVQAWLDAHPGGRVLAYFRDDAYRGPGRVEFVQRYRGQRLAIVSGRAP